jgi:hypothetical protein
VRGTKSRPRSNYYLLFGYHEQFENSLVPRMLVHTGTSKHEFGASKLKTSTKTYLPLLLIFLHVSIFSSSSSSSFYFRVTNLEYFSSAYWFSSASGGGHYTHPENAGVMISMTTFQCLKIRNLWLLLGSNLRPCLSGTYLLTA